MIRIVSLIALCALTFSNGEVERVKGGTTAAPGEFPYQASIQINNEHVCGGVLISSAHVVTAASCLVRILQNPSLMERSRVLLGTISLRRDGHLYGLSRISIHPEYRYNSQQASFSNDIGVIHLSQNVLNNNFIKPINLPGLTEIPQNTQLAFTGWGSVNNPAGPSVEFLQKARLLSINNQECQRFFPSLPIKPYQMCTSANYYVGSCTTDSGSPLVYQNQLVGISTGLHGCAAGAPDVFTKVSYYLKFILDEVSLVNNNIRS